MKMQRKAQRVRVITDRFSYVRARAGFAFAALGCMLWCVSVSAQQPSPGDAVESELGSSDQPMPEQLPALPDEPQRMTTTIGGGPDPVGEYYYTSPLKQLGTDIFYGSYVLSAVVSIAYLAVVYPLQALFGSNKVEPVMLWMLLPVAGPWFAQYEDSVKAKPFWRVVLIGDAALQASGVVVGLIGLALSGRRQIKQRATGSIELKLGVAGAGLAGVTLSVHTL